MYSTLEKIFTAVDNFVPQEDTKILSRNGNTPLHYDPTTEVVQSDEMNEMLRNVCVAEYAARNYDDPKVIEDVERQTGLNYSSCYAPLHSAAREFKAGNPNQLNFLAKHLFKEENQKEEDYKRLRDEDETEEGKEKTLKFVRQEYVNKYSATPCFPEHLIAKGFQVFSTEFCNQNRAAEAVKFDSISCACPCCMYPKNYTPPNARQLKSTLRCVDGNHLINMDKDKIYFVPGRGFMCEAHGSVAPGSRRVVLCW